MSHAEWKDVLDLALALIARESAPAQIFIFLLLAFTALMVLEGLRANFFPWRSVVPRRDKRRAQTLADGPVEASRAHASAPRETASVENRPRLQLSLARPVKRPSQGMRRQKPTRPQIKRMPPLEPSEPAPTLAFAAVNEDTPVAPDVTAPVPAAAEV
jgi:hypothetical protein